jgi:hypothetical protein
LTANERTTLVTLVAEFVLQLAEYWQTSRWISLAERFFFEVQGEDEIADLSQPFFAVDAHRGEEPGEGKSDLNHLFHSHPFLLELGVLLIEIQHNQPIESMAAVGEPVNIYTRYATAWDIIDKPDFSRRVSKSRGSAIKACLRTKFLPYDLGADTSEFRRLVFEYILRPLKLEEYLEVILDDDAIDSDQDDHVEVPSTDRVELTEPEEHIPRKVAKMMNQRLQVFDCGDDLARDSA